MFLLVSFVEQREQHHVVPSKAGDFEVCSHKGTTCSNIQVVTNSVCGKGTEPVIVLEVNGMGDDDLLVDTCMLKMEGAIEADINFILGTGYGRES